MSLYHRLFSIPYMVEMFVREFVPQALAADLDFSRLQRVNAKLHTGRVSARRREGDVIWRLPTRESTGSLYLLFEFQSRIDWWMALRAQVYMGFLWQQVIDECKLKTGERLPPLLTLVIYNGLKPWNAPTQIRDLIALSQESALWSWQPNALYQLLDMSAFPGDELPGFGLEVPQSINLLEMHMRSNLATIGQRWKQEAMALGHAEGKVRGHAEGRAEGKAEGRSEAKAEALVCLLVARFGALAPSVRTRIQRAQLETLDRWFKRAIAAPDLRSVFNSSR